MAAARASAVAKGLGTPERPVWRFALHAPSQEPFMTYLADGALRQQMWTASTAVGAAAPHDNTALIARILALRSEKAALLGKANFAEVVLERRMAWQDRAARVRRFSRGFAATARPPRSPGNAEELERLQRRFASSPAPWAVGFWAEKLRPLPATISTPNSCGPISPIGGVVAGMYELATARLFGLRITPAAAERLASAGEVLPTCTMRAGRHLSARSTPTGTRGNRSGASAWMNSLVTGGPRPDGTRAPHLGLICGNLTPPSETKPALLAHREVETIFHEFGHPLHHLLGEVEIRSLNGTNVPWDFVELPSQIMENWCWEREGLDLFARQYQTGSPIPEELFQKMTAARNVSLRLPDDAPDRFRQDGPRRSTSGPRSSPPAARRRAGWLGPRSPTA